MRLLSSAVWLSVASLVAASPIVSDAERRNAIASNSALKPETVALIQNLATGPGIPGAIVAFTSPKGDGVLSIGNRNADGDPVTPDTHFAIASNSKLFLGTILAWLAENGTKLDNGDTWTLETPLKNFVPNFKMWDNNATEHATTLDFLSHRTGLPPHNFAINPRDTPKIWMERVAHLRPNTGFRTTLTYSNVNYAAITYVVELLTKKSYYDVLEERIFKPLGMEASSDYLQLKASRAEISQGWLRQGVNLTACIEESRNQVPADTTTLPPSCTGEAEGFEFWTDGSGQDWGGGGNVIATGNDMVKWMKEILNPTHIPVSVFERVETPPFPSPSTGGGYALGTVQSQYRGYNTSVHDGALPGSNSFFIRIRNESVGVFALATDDGMAMTWYNAVWPLILDDLLGLPKEVDTPPEDGDPTSGLPVKTPRPTNPRPFDNGAYVGGTFVAPGYEPFTLSTIDLSDSEATEAARIPVDYLRKDVASLQSLLFTDGPILYAAWNQTIGTNILFVHFDGPIYNTTIFLSRSRLPGNRADSESAYIGKWYGGPTAVFTNEGIGFFEGFWGNLGTPGNRLAVEEDVANAAEVFFSRQGHGRSRTRPSFGFHLTGAWYTTKSGSKEQISHGQ